MPGYRLFFIDRFSGHIDRAHEFEADDDSAAIAVGEDAVGDHSIELWRGGRRLQSWEAKDVRPVKPPAA